MDGAHKAHEANECRGGEQYADADLAMVFFATNENLPQLISMKYLFLNCFFSR